eukprot:7387225-Pyramimonas_sp.AAC.1
MEIGGRRWLPRAAQAQAAEAHHPDGARAQARGAVSRAGPRLAPSVLDLPPLSTSCGGERRRRRSAARHGVGRDPPSGPGVVARAGPSLGSGRPRWVLKEWVLCPTAVLVHSGQDSLSAPPRPVST